MADSDYDRVRLENIKRNEEFLRQLGLEQLKTSDNATIFRRKDASGKKSSKKTGNKESGEDVSIKEPTRRSTRIRGEKAVVDDDVPGTC